MYSNENTVEEFVNLAQYLVVTKKEIYTLSQLRTYFQQITGDNMRSIDIKSKLQDCLKDKVMFCKPTQNHEKSTEYVVPSDSNLMPDTIHAVATLVRVLQIVYN